MRTRFPLARLAAALAALGLAQSASALDFKLGDDIKARLGSTVTLGTAVRTEGPDPSVVGSLSAPRVGAVGELGANAGSSDLNFRKNRPVSTVLKGLFDLELQKQDFGLFVRAKAWYDQELEHGSRPYGNIPNAFTQGVSLSDRGFDPHAKFRNALIEDANVFGAFKLGADRRLDLRIGRQVLAWGPAQLIGGGLNIVNPLDLPATSRPGALPEESRIPVGMATAHLTLGPTWSLDGWAQYEFRHTVLPGCGTFFAAANYAPTGCTYVSVLGAAGVSDPVGLASGRYPKRNADVEASDSGQYGLSLGWRMPAIGAELRAYAANYHSRVPNIRVTNPNVAGGYGVLGANPTRLTDPNGLRYAMLYAEDIRLYGLSAATALSPTARVYGEFTYRPNQPLGLNASDLIAAFLTRAPSTALQLARDTNAIAPGGTFDGYDRFKVSTLTLGGGKAWPEVAGASRLTLGAEFGWSKAGGLPDPGVARYGRSDDYGTDAVTAGAACVDNTVAKKACALDGFITSNAWGYRLRAAATYPGVFGATLTPSLTFAHDVQGYSYDGTFVEGRKVFRPALRAEWGQRYFADLVYTRFGGGRYFNQIDRDNMALSGGVRF